MRSPRIDSADAQSDAPANASTRPLSSFRSVAAHLPVVAKLNLLICAAIVVALTAVLFPHWRDNADLSHGYLTPLLFLLLLHEARGGSQRFLSSSLLTRTAPTLLMLSSIAAFVVSGLYAAAVYWTNALVAATLTISGVCALGAAFLVFSNARVRLIPFNWPAIVALLVWIFSAPIPPGTYTRLTLALQLWVTENVLRALHLLGIAATRHGNIIDLATTSVGVEDACSGVRSLISCVFAGLVFSALLLRAPWARAILILLSAPLAIVMNFIRSLLLTLLANRGIDISGAWHDVTGFAVLAVTAGCLAGLAILLDRRPERSTARTVAVVSDSKPSWLHAPVFVGSTTLAALALFFFANTRPALRENAPIPDLAAILPAELPGWRVDTSRDLYQFTDVLRTEHLAQRTYIRPTPEGPEQITIYLAYWRAGQAPVSLVASHTPDACWPGSGWEPVPRPRAREALALPNRSLPPAEVRLFKSGNFPQHVWFWHLYDGRPLRHTDPYSARELLALAWRYGFTREGDQLFVRVSSNRPWTSLSAEPLFAEVFSRLEPLGL
jgi:exosortase